ncbi:MAG TPA: dephospho-CoA kinase [Candidatus Nanoarchaeia archaeon]|nr:dephospho-CoA kinase [Candidatus Nanoarchaeia archaeon]
MIIGLTGNLGSGKTTIAEMFRKRGFIVVNLDDVGKEILKKGKEAYSRVVKAFGKNILDESGEINRKRLADIVFSDGAKWASLCAISHPIVREKMIEVIGKNKGKNLLFDASMLIEAGVNDLVGKVIVVKIDSSIRDERMMQKNMDLQEAKLRLQRQIPQEKREKYADFIIDNSGTVKESEKQVEEILKKLK